jgi:tetratricopeptide (TPR) repeat protein
MMRQAIAAQQRGDYRSAEALYRRILASQPHHADALHFLGLVCHQTGRTEQAVELMSQARDRAPNNPTFQANLGGVLKEQGQLDDAMACFKRALELRPAYPQAWNSLGLTLAALNRHQEAESCYRRALELRRQFPAAWLNLAEALRVLTQYEDAEQACREALALERDNPLAWMELGTTLSFLGRTAEALDALDRALALDPELADLHHEKGLVLSEEGRFDEAGACLRHALVLDRDSTQIYVKLSALRKFTAGDPLIEEVEERLARESADKTTAINLNFTLGKLYTDSGEPERAFRHYLEANRLFRTRLNYSPADQQTYIQSILQHLDGDYLRRHRGAGLDTDGPVFIVGMPRSGTSLVEQILAGHPDMHGGGELKLLHARLRRRLGHHAATHPLERLVELDDAALTELGESTWAAMHALAPEAKHITDKMPPNFMIVGFLHTLFPRAKIIHCRRSPLDTCVSCFTKIFHEGQDYTYDLTELGEFYRLYTQTMAHWRTLLPAGVMLEIQYEEVVDNLEAAARKLVAHCNLPWDPACLNFHTTARPVRTASFYQVRQPIYRSSVGAWRKFDRFLGPLKAALGELATEDTPS